MSNYKIAIGLTNLTFIWAILFIPYVVFTSPDKAKNEESARFVVRTTLCLIICWIIYIIKNLFK
jgi:hypothetical protein